MRFPNIYGAPQPVRHMLEYGRSEGIGWALSFWTRTRVRFVTAWKVFIGEYDVIAFHEPIHRGAYTEIYRDDGVVITQRNCEP